MNAKLTKSEKSRISEAYDRVRVTHHAGQTSRSGALAKLYRAAAAAKTGRLGIHNPTLPGGVTARDVLVWAGLVNG